MHYLTSIAFIPDGNRRYAKKKGVSLIKAYQLGIKKAWQTIEWLERLKETKFITFYALSYQNLQRKKSELKVLSKVFEKEIDKALDSSYFTKKNIRVNFIGRIQEFPKALFEKILLLQDETAKNTEKIVSLALGYDGRKEIIDAVKAIALNEDKKKIESIDENSFRSYLYSDIKDPDLIIRTSGTQRFSGFLLYQASYSELFFTKKLWPEFSKKELEKAISFYKATKRNFGR